MVAANSERILLLSVVLLLGIQCLCSPTWSRDVLTGRSVALLSPDNSSFIYYISQHLSTLRLNKFDRNTGAGEVEQSFPLDPAFQSLTAALIPSGDAIILAETPSNEACTYRAMRVSLTNFTTIWEVTYSWVRTKGTCSSVVQGLPINGRKGTFVFGGLEPSLSIQILEAELATGRLVRNVSYASALPRLSNYAIGENMNISVSEDAVVVYAEQSLDGTVLNRLGPGLTAERALVIPQVGVRNLYYEQHGNSESYVILVGVTIQSSQPVTTYSSSIIMKLSAADFSVVWSRVLPMYLVNVRLAHGPSTHFRSYVLYGTRLTDGTLKGAMVGLNSSTGTLAWSTRFVKVDEIDHVTVAAERELVVAGAIANTATVFKYSVPEFAESLHCHGHNLDECRVCPLGNYWNFTTCTEMQEVPGRMQGVSVSRKMSVVSGRLPHERVAVCPRGEGRTKIVQLF